MSNEPVARPPRDFCATCGFPVVGARCDACGAAFDPLQARAGDARAKAADDASRSKAQTRANTIPETDPSGLERAFEAFRIKDYTRVVEHVLMSEPASLARAIPAPEGSGWIAAVRGALVFTSLVGEDLTLESPVARLPQTSRLPTLRLALELSATESASARVGLRGDLLLLRMRAPVASFTPILLRFHLREIGHLAARYTGLLLASCDALPPVPEDPRTAIGFELLGKPRKLSLSGSAGSGNDAPDSIPPILAPMFSIPPMGNPEGGFPKPLQGSPMGNPEGGFPKPLQGSPMGNPEGGFPKPLPGSPAAASSNAPTPPTPLHRPRSGASGISGAFDMRAAQAPLGAPHPFAPQMPATFDDPRRKPTMPVMDQVRPRPHSTVELEGLAPRPSTSQPSFDASIGTPARAGSESALAPPDRLCAILLQARSLAVPTLEARPATVTWIVRAAVYRVIYEFRDTLPDAVSHLYRATGVGREGPPPSRSAELAAIEPSLAIIDQVIASRAQVPRGEPLVLQPLNSAALAKEHVARFLAEIERAPQEPALRHYLALGGLCELLARTKLPPQTDQRLRDIVTHAQREGPKPAATDLLMTALQRISG